MITTILAVLGAPRPAPAQITATIDSRPSCLACTISIQPRLHLGSMDIIATNTAYLPSDSRGRLYQFTNRDRDHVTVFDSSGRILTRIGRGGSGPGEFSAGILRVFLSDHDSIYVMDSRHARLNVFEPSWRFSRSVNVAGTFYRVVPLRGGGFIGNGDIRTPSAAGYPLHVIGPSGEIVRSFGTGTPRRMPGFETQLVRRIALEDEKTIWAAHEAAYVIELWNIEDGVIRLRLESDADWFSPYASREIITPDRSPQPFVQAIRRDSTSLLWVLVMIPDEDWPSGLGTRREIPGEPPWYELDYPQVYDSRIDVIDPRAGRVVASARFDEYLRGFSGVNSVFGYHETGDGIGVLDVYTITLLRPGR
jgi:hypothetical protein